MKMMKHLIITMWMILFVSVLNGQTEGKTFYVGDVISDTGSFSSNRMRELIPPLLNSTNKIEIRFISSTSFYKPNYLIMTYNREWNATYSYFEKGKDSLLTRDITHKVNIDTVFSQLVSNNLFSLPDHDSLRLIKYEYNTETDEFIGIGFGVVCGICYRIEFKIGDQFRSYNYCNPKSFSEFYSNVPEFGNFVKIVDLFEKWSQE